jgi:hypothetical protein
MRFWRRQSELANLESELRDARPEAPDQLVQSVGERLPREVPLRRLRVVMVGLLTGLLFFGFAAFGGGTYAKDGVEAVITNDGGGNNIEGQQVEDEGPEDDQYEDDGDEGGEE